MGVHLVRHVNGSKAFAIRVWEMGVHIERVKRLRMRNIEISINENN